MRSRFLLALVVAIGLPSCGARTDPDSARGDAGGAEAAIDAGSCLPRHARCPADPKLCCARECAEDHLVDGTKISVCP